METSECLEQGMLLSSNSTSIGKHQFLATTYSICRLLHHTPWFHNPNTEAWQCFFSLSNCILQQGYTMSHSTSFLLDTQKTSTCKRDASSTASQSLHPHTLQTLSSAPQSHHHHCPHHHAWSHRNSSRETDHKEGTTSAASHEMGVPRQHTDHDGNAHSEAWLRGGIQSNCVNTELSQELCQSADV